MPEQTKDIHDKDKKEVKKPKPKGGVSMPTQIGTPMIAGGGLIQLIHDSITGIADILRRHLDSDSEEDSEESQEGIGDNVQFEGDAESTNDVSGELPLGAFDVIGDSDLDSSDPVVETFKNDMGGCGGVVKIIRIDGPNGIEKLSAMLEKLKEVRYATRQAMLDEVFEHINAVATGKGATHQLEAVRKLDKLTRDAHELERDNLLKAREAVLSGTNEHFDAAGFRVRQSMLSYGNKRVAYTTMEMNNGEGYVMLPQGVHQLGYPVTMEVTKFKNQSADAKINPSTGELVNAAATFEKIRDNHASVMERFDTQRHPDNEENLLTLAKGERHKAPKATDRPWEQRLEEDSVGRNKEEKDNTSNIEKKLDDAKKVDWGHQGEPKESVQDVLERKAKVERIDPASDKTFGEQLEKSHKGWTDETIEQLLEDERVGLTEEELDMLLEEWLERERTNKEEKR